MDVSSLMTATTPLTMFSPATSGVVLILTMRTAPPGIRHSKRRSSLGVFECKVSSNAARHLPPHPKSILSTAEPNRSLLYPQTLPAAALKCSRHPFLSTSMIASETVLKMASRQIRCRSCSSLILFSLRALRHINKRSLCCTGLRM